MFISENKNNTGAVDHGVLAAVLLFVLLAGYAALRINNAQAGLGDITDNQNSVLDAITEEDTIVQNKDEDKQEEAQESTNETKSIIKPRATPEPATEGSN